MITDLPAVGKFIQENGLALFVLLAFGTLILTGRLRAGSGSDREALLQQAATNRERQISDDKQATINGLIVEMKEHTVALNRVADGIDERNRIEREMRGRRA